MLWKNTRSSWKRRKSLRLFLLINSRELNKASRAFYTEWQVSLRNHSLKRSYLLKQEIKKGSDNIAKFLDFKGRIFFPPSSYYAFRVIKNKLPNITKNPIIKWQELKPGILSERKVFVLDLKDVLPAGGTILGIDDELLNLFGEEPFLGTQNYPLMLFIVKFFQLLSGDFGESKIKKSFSKLLFRWIIKN